LNVKLNDFKEGVNSTVRAEVLKACWKFVYDSEKDISNVFALNQFDFNGWYEFI
jgi:hypothetical protein